MPYYVVGIIPVGSTVRDDYPLVQSRCHYKVLDVYTIAEVVQDYYSNDTLHRDVEYVFPLPPSAAVCSFKAIIDDDKVIKGIVKEKGEAKKEYKEAVSQGRTAGLLEQEHADVFRVSLGNIKPKQKISVHISFVSIIPHDGSSPQSLRITMPTAIAPRYGMAPTNIPWFGKNGGNRFELTVAVQMSKPVTSVSSPSHPIGLTLGCAQKELQGDYEPSKAFVYLGDSAFLDKDIVIVISSQALDAPRCTAERWLTSEGAEETTDAYALTLVPKFDLPALPSQEYIFLVDRSGSMGGGRMESVKTGLQIMLRSLPSRNTTFNIVSFGSRYTSLWPKSQIYSAETVAEASKHVDTFTASYGGTELRSALQFAFSSRQALAMNATEKTPASAFVLTDGEAWDLDGIINLVTENVEGAKKQDSLLRAFVLGVGNQVSTAMCEGIARAGKGSTVFVAEGEKPDAKLMSLLKAARGGVIEDLAVDWGTSEPEKDLDDDFELVSGISETDTLAPKTQLPPLSLFDEEMSSAEPTEVGPQKISVQLPPPPFIQQAPKSDKLPIPLYPGFRCSIFAIIKQSQNPGPHSHNIKITGKVQGREVAFQVPVNPITIDVGTTTGAMESGKLLHTLAAKALIQQYEEMPSSAETKAHIERLGKRYSLASSVTSFLAIDYESNREVRPTQPVQVEIAAMGYPLGSLLGGPPGGVAPPTGAIQMQQQQRLKSSYRPQAQSQLSSFHSQATPQATGHPNLYQPQAQPQSLSQHQAKYYGQSNSATDTSSVSFGGFGSAPVANSPASASSFLSSNATGSPMAYGASPMASDGRSRDREVAMAPPRPMASIQPMKSSISQSLEREESLNTLTAVTESLSNSSKGFFAKKKKKSSVPSSPPPAPGGAAPSGGYGSAFASQPGGPQPVGSSFAYTYPAVSSLVLTADRSAVPGSTSSAGPVTLESIARAQQFDGSFSHDTAFLGQVCKPKPVPPMPALLSNIAGDADIKRLIWATVLVLACLKRVFTSEKDSWEMMAEKASMFVEDALKDMGADASAVCAALIATAGN